MAQVNIKQPFGYGEFNVEIPEEGQIFRAKNDVSGSAVYKIQGGKLITLKDSDIRRQLAIPQTEQVGVQGFQRAGINFNSLPEFDVNPELFQRVGIGIDTNVNQPISLFTGTSPASSNEKITLAPDPLNPHAQGKPVSSTGRTISPISPQGQPAASADVSGGQQNKPQGTSFDAIQKGLLDVANSFSKLSQERGVALAPEFQKAFGSSASSPSIAPVTPPAAPPSASSPSYTTPAPPVAPPATTNATLSMYESLASAAGIKKVTDDVNESRQNLINETRGQTSRTALYESELKRRGVDVGKGLVSDLNKRILEQNKAVRDLYKDIKAQGEYHGITEAQFERIAAAEAQPHLEILRDLLEERNVAQQEVDRQIADVKDYVNLQVQDEAIRLKAFELDVQNKEGAAKDLKDEISTVFTKAIEERKEILKTADDASKNGAPKDVIDSILGSSSPEKAIQNASTYLQEKKYTSRIETIGGRKIEIIEEQLPNQPPKIISQKDLGISGEQKGTLRDEQVSSHLESSRGSDGFVSANSYQESLRRFIANGGTMKNFFASFPKENYLSSEEEKKLPESIKNIMRQKSESVQYTLPNGDTVSF